MILNDRRPQSEDEVDVVEIARQYAGEFKHVAVA